jgi:hypothetical protein
MCVVRTTTEDRPGRRGLAAVHDTTLILIPTPRPELKIHWTDGMHLLGTLMSAMLLSLGAPFWFPTLKEAVALRPIVVRKMSQEPTGR